MAQYIDIIFFAILAAFLFFKLRNVIGETDDEVVIEKTIEAQKGLEEQKPKMIHVASSSAVVDALKAMHARDPSFNPVEFINNAKSAFEMIVKAYVIGDRNTLRLLLSPELFKRFENDIQSREDKGEILQITINDYKRIQITDVDVRENYSKIEVTFEVEEVVFTRDINGNIIDGNETDIDMTTDIWTFEKEIESQNPTWYLVETRSDNEEKF